MTSILTEGVPAEWREARVQSGLLEVSGGQKIWWADFGREEAVPFVVLHGGPGSGSNLESLTFFDPLRHRVVFIDQRGTGRSTPAGCLVNNTTWHLVDDIEMVRRSLGLPGWHVFGGSWGATLALIYAQQHPMVTLSLILRGLSNRHEHQTDWVLNRRAQIQPERHDAFLSGLTEVERKGPITSLYAQIISGHREAVLSATRAVVALEAGLRGPVADHTMMLTAMDSVSCAQIQRARIFLHYWYNHSFLGNRGMIFAPEVLSNVRCIVLHGAQDWVCPPSGAQDIVARLPYAELTIIEGVGHSPFVPEMTRLLRLAVEQVGNVCGSCHVEK